MEEYTSDEEYKHPTYVLGQKVPDFRTAGSHVTHDDLIYAEDLQPFVVVVDKPNGKRRNYVGVVGRLDMVDQNTVGYALMVIGLKKVVRADLTQIFMSDCDLLPPRGIDWDGDRHFDPEAVVDAFWNPSPEAQDDPAGSA